MSVMRKTELRVSNLTSLWTIKTDNWGNWSKLYFKTDR